MDEELELSPKFLSKFQFCGIVSVSIPKLGIKLPNIAFLAAMKPCKCIFFFNGTIKFLNANILTTHITKLDLFVDTC